MPLCLFKIWIYILSRFYFAFPVDLQTIYHKNYILFTENPICSTGKYISAVIKSIGEEIVQLERNSEDACIKFIKKHSQNLHPNHFFLMDIKLVLCQIIGKGGLQGQVDNEKVLKKKQKLCLQLLEVVNKISPGELIWF